MDKIVASAQDAFAKIFGGQATAYGEAPGRVEVLGNHTDYNEGFILSAAIDRYLVAVGRPVAGNTATVHSLTLNSRCSFDVANPVRSNSTPWSNYIAGVVWQLQKVGRRIGGFEAVISGNVPLGAGLAGSAALELATALFLKKINGFEMDPIDLALNCQAAENDFVGVNCGILDQFCSVMGHRDHLVFLDCRELSAHDSFPLSNNLDLIIADTRASRTLQEGAYNQLRESCFRAAEACAKKYPDRMITHLRDVTMSDLLNARSSVRQEDFPRARHIISENERVQEGTAALNRGDAATMGRLMNESHASSRDDFGNSSSELNIMANIAQSLPGCYGARLSGGGFGGATVNLIDAAKAMPFAEELAKRYQKETGIRPELHLFHASQGATSGMLT